MTDVCGSTVLINRGCLATGLLVMAAALCLPVCAAGGDRAEFKRIPKQFIAALGDPGATSGSNAQLWGLWPVDPGPRGVNLSRFEKLE
jgi:hypothetical protein